MHQNGLNRHPRGANLNFFTGAMAVNRRQIGTKAALFMLAVGVFFGLSALGQSTGGQSQGNAQSQDIPDAPSTVQPPAPKPTPPPVSQPAEDKGKEQEQAQPTETPKTQPTEPAPQEQQAAPPQMPPVQTVPPGSLPTNQINPKEDLYKLVVPVNFVLVPVMVKDSQGRRVDGLLPKDFAVVENGKKQTLTYFTSDPFQLSVAILLDTGMPDVALQKIHQTYTALLGAFSPYDEVALYTYSSTVNQVTDFNQRTDKLAAVFNDMKLNVRGHNNGPPVLGGPLGPQGPTINGIPVGTSGPPPVYTPPREARVMNDAILRAALDLSKRDKTRRRVIFVISDGRELGSKASYRDVLKLLETRDIQVKGVVVDSGALPVYRTLERVHLKGQGYGNILPRYVSATGGGQVMSELSRNAIEDAYAEITSEARNQYTLGYTPSTPPPGRATAYRDIEVMVNRKNLSVFTKVGYYPIPTAR
jgi:VWFA-related protein